MGEEKERIQKAIRQFRTNPGHPGLKFETLGNWPIQNHCSIRVSREFRLILAVDAPDFHEPRKVKFVYAGHHDPAYDWSQRQGMYSDFAAGIDPGKVKPRTDP